MDKPTTDQLLYGLDDIRVFFEQADDSVMATPEGLQIGRIVDNESRLVQLSWEPEYGLVRLVAGAALPKVPEPLRPQMAEMITQLNAELAIPACVLSNGSMAAWSYAFLNADGSLSARVIEHCLMLAIGSVKACEARARPILDAG